MLIFCFPLFNAETELQTCLFCRAWEIFVFSACGGSRWRLICKNGGNFIYLHKWQLFRVLSCCMVLMLNLLGDCKALTHGQKLIPSWKSCNSINHSLWQGKILRICLQTSARHGHHYNINSSCSYYLRNSVGKAGNYLISLFARVQQGSERCGEALSSTC